MTSGFWRSYGLKNGLRAYMTTHFATLWKILHRLPKVRSMVNRFIINRLVYTMPTRPVGLSTLAAYASWQGLTDRAYSARHLPPDPELQMRLPSPDTIGELFRRPETGGQVTDKSTLLFPHFAQWFVDGFLRTDPDDPVKNTSTHDIDLSQLYGQTPEVTKLLRLRSETKGRRGRLKSQDINGEEFPPYYFGENGEVEEQFKKLRIDYPGSDRKAKALEELKELDPRKHNKLFALGIPRGNIHYGFTMMSTLFLREHNRIAGLIAAEHPDWKDERVFQTTRNTLTVVLLKICIEDYINHITPIWFKLFVEPGIGVKQKWYRQNWMSIEFNLLYRWHSLIPNRVRVGGEIRDIKDVMWDTDLVTTNGLAALFDEASRQPSNAIGLLNTDESLMEIETKTIEIGRKAQLASFNDYRKRCGYPKLKSFQDLSSNPEVQSALASRYGNIDNVELYVGLFAEDVRQNSVLPTLMGTMVAVDAFSQALTNPLLAPGIFGKATFSRAGMKVIKSTKTLSDIVARNVVGESIKPYVSFTQQNWLPA